MIEVVASCLMLVGGVALVFIPNRSVWTDWTRGIAAGVELCAPLFRLGACVYALAIAPTWLDYSDFAIFLVMGGALWMTSTACMRGSINDSRLVWGFRSYVACVAILIATGFVRLFI